MAAWLHQTWINSIAAIKHMPVTQIANKKHTKQAKWWSQASRACRSFHEIWVKMAMILSKRLKCANLTLKEGTPPVTQLHLQLNNSNLSISSTASIQPPNIVLRTKDRRSRWQSFSMVPQSPKCHRSLLAVSWAVLFQPKIIRRQLVAATAAPQVTKCSYLHQNSNWGPISTNIISKSALRLWSVNQLRLIIYSRRSRTWSRLRCGFRSNMALLSAKSIFNQRLLPRETRQSITTPPRQLLRLSRWARRKTIQQ